MRRPLIWQILLGLVLIVVVAPIVQSLASAVTDNSMLLVIALLIIFIAPIIWSRSRRL